MGCWEKVPTWLLAYLFCAVEFAYCKAALQGGNSQTPVPSLCC